MNTREPETALNPEEEFRRLREKTGREELDELKHGLLGGYRRRDVAQYVARLRNQLQTAERTYKNRIAELAAEKDQLRYERDALQDRFNQADGQAPALPRAESAETGLAPGAFLGERGAFGDALAAITGADDEPAAYTLENALLRRERDALLGDRDVLLGERDALEAEKVALTARLESLERSSGENEAALRGDLQELLGQIEVVQALCSRYEAELAEAVQKIASLEAQNADLCARLDDAGQANDALKAENDALEDVNARMRDTLNILVVHAEALVRENGAVRDMLESERDNVRQYQAMNGRLSDLLARVRTANQLLNERVADMDRAFSGLSGPFGKPDPTAAPRRAKPDAADLADARDPLKDLAAELDAIQASMAQYQVPSRPAGVKGKKPIALYSLEKQQADCKPEDPGISQDVPEDLQQAAAE